MTDIRQINLPYQKDLVRIFQAMRDLPYPILLDSNHADFPETEFDIVVANPLATVRASYPDWSIEWREKTLFEHPSSASPFEAIEHILYQMCQQSWAQKAPTTLPFTGGFVGYFGYGSRLFLEQLPNQTQQDIHLDDLVTGLYGWAIISKHKTRETLLMATPLCSDAEVQSVLQRLEIKPVATKPFSLLTPFQSNMTADTYQEKFEAVQEYIRSGDCYQVNLAQRVSSQCHGDPFHAYHCLRSACPTPYAAFMEWDSNKAILSHSPERFLQSDQGVIESKPIKGTRPRGKNPVEDAQLSHELLTAEKDRAENLMIVDLLRNDMGRSCITGSIKVPKLFALESYANVHHMVSTITGRIENKWEPFKVFKYSFPGGSITGAPKIRAMQIIDELEPHTRSAYCGSIGYFSCNGQMDSSITIRTLVIDDKQIHCWAGGGLVLDSQCDEEYQETFTKIDRLTHTLEHEFLT